ncbi:MAG: alpha/beta hydrolase family protein [Planctomycetaceae bacterium]
MHRLISNAFAALGLIAALHFHPPIRSALAAEPDTARGDRMLAEYFRVETKRLEDRSLADIQSADDWNARKGEYRAQLFDMLGLDPLPEKSPLKPVVTGTVEKEGIVLEKLHFQSLPGLYVTGNLYRPAKVDGELPTILYVCGHSRQVENGRSFGNKTGYQRHGVWFAKNGYVCLTIDSLQLGEIEGLHHGLYDKDMWWWLNRGYTPAGVEAWNCIRALDYLETRPEVDAKKFGVTGRSGGGIYSWWLAALDDRIAAAVPVAGITSMRNHVDGCIEGHCDCMYHVNSRGWDFEQVAALVAPRPLLILNSDADRIFPEDGVRQVHRKTRRIYELLNAGDDIDIAITKGAHQDTPELQELAFRWFDKHLKGAESNYEAIGEEPFTLEEQAVFGKLPTDSINAKIHETFVPQVGGVRSANLNSHDERATLPPPKVPKDAAEWKATRERLLRELREKTFAAWPKNPPPVEPKLAFTATNKGVTLSAYDFVSQEPWELRLFVATPAGVEPKDLELMLVTALDEESWRQFLGIYRVGFEGQLKEYVLPEAQPAEFAKLARSIREQPPAGSTLLVARGIGPTAWTEPGRKGTHIRRRFMLLGQTLDSARTWDIRRGVQSVRSIPGLGETSVWLQGTGDVVGPTLYAALFEPKIEFLTLRQVPVTHRQGPYLLNASRILDAPQAVALAAETSLVQIIGDYPADVWKYAEEVGRALGHEDPRIEVRSAKP